MAKIYLCKNQQCLWGGAIYNEQKSTSYSDEEYNKILKNICPECGRPLSLISRATRNYGYIYYIRGRDLAIRNICPNTPRLEIEIQAGDAVELKDFIQKHIEEDWLSR